MTADYSELKKVSVKDVQKEVIELLAKIENLMERASGTLKVNSTDQEQEYAKIAQNIAEFKRNVEKLELVMSIVAPMKAGKSTIINAVVGFDLLPSRAAAMTTLPTKIVLKNDCKEPILTVPEDCRKAFNIIVKAIKGMSATKEMIATYPHLEELLQQVKTADDRLFNSDEVKGTDEIKRVLTALNDIVRLSSILEPTKDPLAQITDLPRIETPFWRSQKQDDQANLLGSLVLVDTPGPNEAGNNLKLSAVVKDQLEKSAIILIVLDFTQLNNQAADDIKRQVKPIINILKEENLYVLVNKVDQRTEKDSMTPEKVKQFVLADLDLGNPNDTDRVFEVAARRAFCATNFLTEAQNNGDMDIQTNNSARALAEQTLGIRWKDKLKTVDIEDLKGEADFIWEESGFPSFLDRSINALMEKAAPKVMDGALKYCKHHLETTLKNDVSGRITGITGDSKKIQNEIRAIETDLNRLNIQRARFKEVESIKHKLQKNLREILEGLKESALVDLKDFFAKKTSALVNLKDVIATEEYEKADLRRKVYIEAKNLIDNIPLFTDFISKMFRKVELKTSGVIEFSSEVEAESFANQSILYVKEKSETILSNYTGRTGRIKQEIDQARQELTDFLKQEVQPIIDEAQARLNQNFNVDLSLPELSLGVDKVNIPLPRAKSKSRMVDQGYETYKVKKRDFWNWLWLVEFEVPETRKKPDRKENYYLISLEELIPEINKSIEKSIKNISSEIDKYIDEDFKQRVDSYFNNLDAFLSSYRDSLIQGQSDKLLSEEDQKKLINELDNIGGEATKHIKKCSSHLDLIKHLYSTT